MCEEKPVQTAHYRASSGRANRSMPLAAEVFQLWRKEQADELKRKE